MKPSCHRLLTTSRPTAFTLVELLVVIAIIGVLTGLILPAVQAAREAARRMQCSNNLRQIGIALHNYHDTHQRLPPGCLQWRGPGRPVGMKQFAWSAMILPFIEQTNLHLQIDFHVPFDSPRNAVPAATMLQVYLCPSALQSPSSGRGKTDYGGLYGQRITTRSATDNGVFIYDISFRFADVRDGLSNTICIGEDTRGPDSEWINGRNVFEQSGGINDPDIWIGDNEIRSDHTGGAQVLLTDGHVQLLPNTLDRLSLAALITRAEGDLATDFQN